METSINISKQQHAMDILENLNSFKKKQKYCDFVIKAGRREIAVHRHIMAGASDYFDAMLSHETLESETGVAVIKDINPEFVEKGIEYIYTGELSVAEENYQPMMHLAHMWQLQKLCNGIAENLGNNLDLSAFFYTKNVAKLYNCENLVLHCNEFALKNFSEILKLDEFGSIEKDDVKFLIANYSQGHTMKLQAVLKWVNHDVSSRKECLIGFMESVDLTKIPLEHRRFIVENEPLIKYSNELLHMWMRSFFHSCKIGSSDPGQFVEESSKKIVVFERNSKRFQSFNMAEKSWTPILPMNNDVTDGYFTTCVSGQHLFVFSAKERKNFCIQYSEPDQWKQLADRNIVGEVQATLLNGFIYLSDRCQVSNRMEAYNINQNTWNWIPGKLMHVKWEALSTFDGSVFSVGGLNCYDKAVTNVERFDPVTSLWKNAGNLNVARRSSSVTTDGRTIFVLGGYNTAPLSCVEFCCPVTQSWTRLTSTQFPRFFFNSLCINGKIYVIGGDRNSADTIEEYDPELKQWIKVISMNEMNINRVASVALPV